MGVGCGVRSATPLYPFIILYLLLFLFLFLLLCRALSVDVDRFVFLGVYALFISLPCFLHIGEERRKGNFFQRLQRVGDFTGFQILPTSKKDIDRRYAGRQPWGVVKYDDLRLRYQIPKKEILVTGIPQNPR